MPDLGFGEFSVLGNWGCQYPLNSNKVSAIWLWKIFQKFTRIMVNPKV